MAQNLKTMNKIFKISNAVIIAISCLLAASCCKDNGTAKVHVRVNDFTISQEEIGTKSSTDVADYSGVKAITLAFYTSNGDEQCKVTQMRADATTYTTFGEFDLSLPMGSYTMVVLGYGLNDGEPAITLTSPTSATFGDNPARETFVATQTVNITNTDAVTLSATLNRIVSKLKIHSTDGCTENAVSVRTTLSAAGKAFNPTSGLATSNTGFVNTLPIQSAVGNPTNSITYLFLATDEQTVNVTIDVLDANGNSISHKEVSDVPFQRNRMTVLTGSLYSSGGNGSFQVETDWLDDYNTTF